MGEGQDGEGCCLGLGTRGVKVRYKTLGLRGAVFICSISGRRPHLLYIGVRVKGSILWLKIREGISRTPLRERGWAGI